MSNPLANLASAEVALSTQVRRATDALHNVGTTLPVALEGLRAAAIGASERIVGAREQLYAIIGDVVNVIDGTRSELSLDCDAYDLSAAALAELEYLAAPPRKVLSDAEAHWLAGAAPTAPEAPPVIVPAPVEMAESPEETATGADGCGNYRARTRKRAVKAKEAK